MKIDNLDAFFKIYAQLPERGWILNVELFGVNGDVILLMKKSVPDRFFCPVTAVTYELCGYTEPVHFGPYSMHFPVASEQGIMSIELGKQIAVCADNRRQSPQFRPELRQALLEPFRDQLVATAVQQ